MTSVSLDCSYNLTRHWIYVIINNVLISLLPFFLCCSEQLRSSKWVIFLIWETFFESPILKQPLIFNWIDIWWGGWPRELHLATLMMFLVFRTVMPCCSICCKVDMMTRAITQTLNEWNYMRFMDLTWTLHEKIYMKFIDLTHKLGIFEA